MSRTWIGTAATLAVETTKITEDGAGRDMRVLSCRRAALDFSPELFERAERHGAFTGESIGDLIPRAVEELLAREAHRVESAQYLSEAVSAALNQARAPEAVAQLCKAVHVAISAGGAS